MMFTQENKVHTKRSIIIMVTMFTSLILIIVYSGYTTIKMNQAREDYARALLCNFTIIDVDEDMRSAFYRNGSFLSPNHFFDVNDFISIAHQQNVRILYRVIPDTGRYVYYYFESPIYFENYMAYEREITPPIRYVTPRFDRPVIRLDRIG
jgi:hypothetical protein